MNNLIALISPSGQIVVVDLSTVSIFEALGYKPYDQTLVLNPGTTLNTPSNTIFWITLGLFALLLIK